MKLKFLEAVEATDTGRRLPEPMRRMKVVSFAEVPHDLHASFRVDREFRVGLEFQVRSRVSDADARAGAINAVRDQAQRRLAREIYSDVADEVFSILEGMWDEGLRDDSLPVRRAERLLRLLAGDDVRPLAED